MITILHEGLNHVIDMDLINNGSVMIDAGAGRGGFVKKMRKFYNCHIFCIECSKSNIVHIGNADFSNITLIHKALVGTDQSSITYTEYFGDPAQGTDGYFEWGNIYGHHKPFLSQRGAGVGMLDYEVETTRLDLLMDQYSIQHVDYLKMDIEDAEYDVLQNLDDTYLQRIKQISVELHTDGKNKALIERMARAGFSHQEFPKNEHYFAK